ncbi:OCIA domain containing 2 L homeolog [Xenopus laevis]|uniref:MGC85005 protein n=1 Tax=Xenopus laevis TaxID=8355 RepID=Q5EAV7_XENLA|nr:OCIA domain containing 2 L homeolog [Xenopus laevis]AAH90227.1 MGC85005 protein [Xenopus laevis]
MSAETVPAAAAAAAAAVPAQDKKPCPVSSSLMHCPMSYAHREDFAKVMKECKEESFWYRALPISLGSMLVTQGLVYKGYLSRNKRFGSLPKVALAGVLGYMIGKISYARTFQKKFEEAGMQPLFDAGFVPPFAQKKSCRHTCEECKAKSTTDQGQNTQASAPGTS